MINAIISEISNKMCKYFVFVFLLSKINTETYLIILMFFLTCTRVISPSKSNSVKICIKYLILCFIKSCFFTNSINELDRIKSHYYFKLEEIIKW